MAYSTVQRLALASGLVLAVSLLLPKAFLSRGKRQEPPPAPEGKCRPAPLEPPGIPAKRRENAARGRGDSGSLWSPVRYPQIWRKMGRHLVGATPRGCLSIHGHQPSPPSSRSPLLTEGQGPGIRAHRPGHSLGGLHTPVRRSLLHSLAELSEFRCFQSGGLPLGVPLYGFRVLSVVLLYEMKPVVLLTLIRVVSI